MHRIIVTERAARPGDRDCAGGVPLLDAQQDDPRCKICSALMLLFFQFDLRPEFGLPFQSGSHLMVFMCPEHNDASLMPFGPDDEPLPHDYWDLDAGHYALILNRPTAEPPKYGDVTPYLQAKQLDFLAAEENVVSSEDFEWGSSDFKVGGVPGWINYKVEKRCQCGGDMRFLCQVPENFGFAQTIQALPQPDGFSSTEYGLLLGNQVTVLACSNQCDPRALIVVCDN